MKLCIISDTHSFHRQVNVPEVDCIIHCGDITWTGEMSIIEDFCYWMSDLPHRYKICIAGNHDRNFERSWEMHASRKMMQDAGIIYLQDSGVEIEGIFFYGSPWTPFFNDWSFNLPRGKKIAEKWKLIPDKTNCLITHGQCKGILDYVPGAGSQGCEDLLNRVNELKNLKLVAGGHLHYEGSKTVKINNVIFANAAICTEEYKPTNPPIVIDL
jgi:predicted phosphodiesterase